MPSDHVVVKLDFTDAFNCLHRSAMLQAVADRVPELFPYCFSAYSKPSVLFYGAYTILSQEGPQQGDPIGPGLFCNTIHPLLESLISALKVGYMDDLTLGGSQDMVARDVELVRKAGAELGLLLNVSKCELISHPGCIIHDPTLQSFIQIPVTDATLLGAPLFPGSVLDNAWSIRCEDLTRAVDRLSLLESQDALILLRASFSAPRVQHLLRCSPSADNQGLQKFDDLLKSAISRITNSKLSDLQWLQASLPIKQGGLGIRRVSSLATPAFLASAASTLCLQERILEGSVCPMDTFLETLLSVWSTANGTPPDPLPGKQSFWDKPGNQCDRALIKASLVEHSQRARFKAMAAPHSGDWLLALPIASCGLRLSDEEVRVAVGLRLGLDLCVPHTCCCGAQVDAQGLHAFVCKKVPGRTVRHHMLNDIFWRALTSAGIPATKEPVGLVRQDGKRPDGLTLIPWQGGKPLTWDVTVVSTLAVSYVQSAGRGAGSVAELAAERKSAKYTELLPSYIFQPIAVENLGPINSSAIDFINDLGGRLTACSGEAREASFLFQRLSVTIQRFNSVLLHDTFPVNDEPDQ